MVHTRGRGSKNKNKREMMLVFLDELEKQERKRDTSIVSVAKNKAGCYGERQHIWCMRWKGIS